MLSENIHMTGDDHALYHVIQQVPLFSATGTESILIFHSFRLFKKWVSTMYQPEF